MIMNKYIQAIVLLLVLTIGMCLVGCSKDDNDPEDYYTSLLSGEYGKGKLWTLYTIINGDTIQTDGFVRFDSKDLKDADIRFINVIPEESFKEFKNVELSASERGCTFTIDYTRENDDIHISGAVVLGEMTIDMTLSE